MKKILFLLLGVFLSVHINAQENAIIKGIVRDKSTQELLPGATVYIKENQKGTMTNLDGSFFIAVKPGTYHIESSFVSYQKNEKEITVVSGENIINFDMGESVLELNEVVVTAKSNKESEAILVLERKKANYSVENIGSDELSRKGLSDVEEGVTKITGISSMGPQQIFVRGLGDRYNNATLNNMPIPSGNPTMKVIDLSLIPSKVVQNINVNKTFNASSYADFSGANIDIITKTYFKDFLVIGGGLNYNTLSANNLMRYDGGFNGFKSLIGFNNSYYNLPNEMGTLGDATPQLTYDPFHTNFSYKETKLYPSFNFNLAGAKNMGNFNILFAASFDNDFDYSYGNKRLYETGGSIIYDFGFDKWSYNANTSLLTSMNYNNIGMDVLFINNTSSSIEENEGYHSTNDGIIKARRYEYLNNRVLSTILRGNHFSDNLNWKLSYNYSNNNTPDRRDLTWNYNEDTDLYYLRRENIANYRTYMNMVEHEISGRGDYVINLNNGNITSGIQYKYKNRTFLSRDFFYETRNLPGVQDPTSPEDYFTDEYFENGTLSLSEGTALSNYYLVFQSIYSAYSEINYNLTDKLFVNVGVRFEYDNQDLYYRKAPERTSFQDPWIILNTSSPGFYPALNFKYSTSEKGQIRLSSSRTISRPLFVELGPFVNRGMYGEYNTFGNPNLTNSYNYNLDLKYEYYPNPGDLYSFGIYGKYIDNPIEKFYKASSAQLMSWLNSDNAKVAGFEIEAKKKIRSIYMGLNFAYLYSRIDLGDDVGINTNSLRPLQGASPYLVNADITYPIKFRNGSVLSSSLVYNTFGKRIYAVGTDGRNDIYEQPIHSLDVLFNYKINNKLKINAGFKNVLNPTTIYTLNIDGNEVITNEYNEGTIIKMSINYNLN
jgi:hypothetical protein